VVAIPGHNLARLEIRYDWYAATGARLPYLQLGWSGPSYSTIHVERQHVHRVWQQASADEGALDDETRGMAERAFLETEAFGQFLDVLEHVH
jgi:hypothetical protein